MTLGAIILQYRAEHSLSQRQFALRCGVSNGYIAMLERNCNPATGKPMVVSMKMFRSIAQAMGMTANELINVVDESTPVSLSGAEDDSDEAQRQSTIADNIGARIRSIRKKMNMSQQELAKRSGVRQAVISEIETSAKLPALDSLIDLAHALGVEPSDLMGEKFCPVCGFEYSYDEGLNSEAHHRIHARTQAWVERYGFFWPYRDRKIEYTTAYSVLYDEDEPAASRFSAAVRLFCCLFCRSVSAYSGDDHPTFEEYAAMLLGSDYAAQLPPDIRAMLSEKYGEREDALTGTYYQRRMENASPRLCAIIEKLRSLPDEALGIIEYICDHSAPREE